jgi:hypothetical protein
MKILFTIIFYLIPLTALSQNTIESYQYWFNSDNENKISGLTGQDPGLPLYSFSTSIGSDGLPEGLHVLNLRFRDSGKKWSPVLSRFFYKMPTAAATDATIDRVSYWFNNDIAGATEEAVSGSGSFLFNPAIAADGLPDGLHVLNLRFRDSGRKWSPVLSRFFYKMPAAVSTDVTIDRVNYWFNNNIAGAAEEAVSGSGSFLFNPAIAADGLPDGLHVLNVRFRDSGKKWSPVMSRFFYKMPSTSGSEASITSYSYWFNNDIVNAVEQSVPQSGSIVINEKFDAATLSVGLHVLNIRFKDTSGKWSGTLSRFFYKMPVQEMLEDNLVKAYRYWFNEDDSRIFNIDLDVPVNPLHLLADIETPYLAPGMHNVHIQFLDMRGKWSPALTSGFETEGCALPRYINDPVGPEEVCHGSVEVYSVQAALNIEEFEWSLTPAEAGTLNPDGSSITVQWNEGFTGVAELVVYGSNPCGESETRSLTVTVVSDPYVTAMNNTSVCEGGSVLLDVLSSNGNLEWNVADLTVSPLTETTYTVTASNACGVAEDQVIISIVTPPSLSVMDDVVICEGVQVELTAASDGTVTWSGGSAFVSPVVTTSYTATASKGACQVVDEVTVTVNPAPGLTVMDDIVICLGDEVVLEAQSEGVLTWSVNNTTVSPSQTTAYQVTSSKDGCESHGEVIITVDYLPELTVMDNVSICQGEQVELTAVTTGILSWSGGEEIVTPTTTTIYTAAASNNCGTVDDNVTVTVKPLPSLEVMDDLEICKGEELLLIAESDGVVTWSSGTEQVAPAESITYTAYAEKDGCEIHREVLVTVHPLPDQPLLEQVDEALYSSSESGNIWFFNNNEMVDVTGNQYSPGESGEYFVRVISTGGCTSDPSNTISFTISNLIKIGMSEITVYPNPVKDKLFISPGLPSGEPIRIELLTLGGRVLMIRNITNESYINVAGLSPSVYILKISRGEESSVLRIVKD